MIFAAGLGTRLKPMTNHMPKAMVSVDGKPLLWHTIQKLKRSGFDEIIINVHHFADQIIDYVKSNNYFDIRIEFSDESNLLLNTGGGIKKAKWFFDDGKPFLVHNVDIFSNINLREAYNQFSEDNAWAHLIVSPRETSRYLLFDDQNRLSGWMNKSSGETKSPFSDFDPQFYHAYAFSGIHLLSPQIFELMESFPEQFSIIDFYVSVCKKVKIAGNISPEYDIVDVGKPEALSVAKEFLKQKK